MADMTPASTPSKDAPQAEESLGQLEQGDSSATEKRFLVVEHFKDAGAVYSRLWSSGRMAPDGLVFVSAWVDENLDRRYLLMETHDHRLLHEWMANWKDLIDFEVHSVITPEEAGERIAAQFQQQ
jgi:hypothetical protein